MNRPVARRFLLLLTLMLNASGLSAADLSSETLAERPSAILFASSIKRLQAVCDAIFDSVGRGDLSRSLGDRQESYNHFAGIDEDKPLGIMLTWGVVDTPHVVFLPVKEVQDLLKTATFGIVEFQQVDKDQYEIDRPGNPYHVLIRDEYACFAESVSTIRSVRTTPERLTRNMRDRYDVALHFDLLQVPKSTKVQFVDALRKWTEPLLQPRDDEMIASASARRTCGRLLLDLVERAVLDTNTVTFGLRIESATNHVILEVVVEAQPRSRMATVLNQAVTHSNKFEFFLQSDALGGFVFDVMANDIAGQILGITAESRSKNSRIGVGLQLTGTRVGDLQLVAACHGSDIAKLNSSLSQGLPTFEKLGLFEQVDECFEDCCGVILHSLIPREIPQVITQWFGKDLELIVGQGKQEIWFGVGSSDKVLERIEHAIEEVNYAPPNRQSALFCRGRMHAGKLPELMMSDLLIPDLNAELIREELSHGEDGISVKLEPIKNGIKLQAEFEEGFIRLVGRDWVRQIERGNRE